MDAPSVIDRQDEKGPGVVVRGATRQDVPLILEIYNEAVLPTTASADYAPQSLATRLAWFEEHRRDGYPIMVAQGSGGEIAGWSSLSKYHPRIGYRFTAENSVYVAPGWRGKGIGRLLLEPLLQSARKMGLRAIIASISADNEASIHLHTKLGFKQVAYLKDVIFKFDRWLDVVFLELVLE